MKTIPVEVVDEEWSRFTEAPEEEIRALAARMQEEQPFLLVYLHTMDEELFKGEERGRLMELGAIIWRIMDSQGTLLRPMKDTDIEKAEEANVQMLESMEEGSEIDMMGAMGQLFANYNQMPLMGAVLESLMSGYEEEPDLAPENTGMALLHLKTVIDCLDQ